MSTKVILLIVIAISLFVIGFADYFLDPDYYTLLWFLTGIFYVNWAIIEQNKEKLATGFPTHSVDITGKQICVGDKVTYDFEGETCSFIVVFEDNAFRKEYTIWDKTLQKPILEYGVMAEKMRLKVVCSATKATYKTIKGKETK